MEMRKDTKMNIVNVEKDGGEGALISDFDDLKRRFGVTDDQLTHEDGGVTRFTTNEGTISQRLTLLQLITEVYEATDWEVPFRLDPFVKALSPEDSERACVENDKSMLRKFGLPLWYARE